MKTIKLTKKLRKEIEAERSAALGMLSFAENQVTKTEAEGNTVEIKKAKDYLKTVNDVINECNEKLGG